MTVISIRQDKAVYILDEDNNFVCSHINYTKENATDWEGNNDGYNFICDDCDMYAPAFIDGIDEDGRPEYNTPEMWEWQ